MTCFEGMKAYQGVDGRMRLFRPDMNMARLRRSANRLQLADFDPRVCKGVGGWVTLGGGEAGQQGDRGSRCENDHRRQLISIEQECEAMLRVAPPARALTARLTCPLRLPCAVSLQELLGCLKQLLLVDRSWLPAQEGYSIYVRPFAFSSGKPVGGGEQ